MIVHKIYATEWKKHFSELAHKVCFDRFKPSDKERIDYALFVTDSQEKPAGYITVKELDEETAYWQFGGTFPGTQGTVQSWRAYRSCIEWTRRNGYKRIGTYIENKNAVMLKFASKAGFIITGCRNFKGDVLLEHTLELNNG